MDINQQKEQFSNVYVRAVVTVAGYSLYRPEVDDDSIDLGIVARSGTGKVQAPRLELQLKCTSTNILDGRCARFPLPIKNYNDLRITSLVPRILVVVLVPKSPDDWLHHSETEMCLRRCGYWVSLREQPTTQNSTAVTVELPRSNQFNVESITSVMNRISQGCLQ